MRAVQAARNQAFRQQLSEVNPKFQAGPNELEKEDELKILQPTNAEQLKQLTALVETLRRQNLGDQAWQNALRLWQSQIATGALSDQVKFQFVRRFYFWLLGRGTTHDVERTSWGRANVAVLNREVSLYIQQFSQRRLDYALQLSLLAMRVPSSLNGYYLYFKYIVNGKLKRAKDNNGGSWWELSDDDYLQDFEMFQQEFDGADEKANYKPLIRATANRPAGSAPFDASRPYPTNKRENEQHQLEVKDNKQIVADVMKQENSEPNDEDPLPEAMDTTEDGMEQDPVRGQTHDVQPVSVNLPAMGVAPTISDAQMQQMLGEVRATLAKNPASQQAFEAAQSAREAKVAAEAAANRPIPTKEDIAASIKSSLGDLSKAIETNKPASARAIAAEILNGVDPVTGVSLVRMVGHLAQETANVKALFYRSSKSIKREDKEALDTERKDTARLLQETITLAQREQVAKDALAAEKVRSGKLEAELSALRTQSGAQTKRLAEYEAALRNAAQEVAATSNNAARLRNFTENMHKEATAAVNNLRQQNAATKEETSAWRSRFEQLANEYKSTLQTNSAALQQLLQERTRSKQDVQYLANVIAEYEEARLHREREDAQVEQEFAARQRDISAAEEELMQKNLEAQAEEYEKRITEKKLRAEEELRKFMQEVEEDEAFESAMRSREGKSKRQREQEEDEAFQTAMEGREEEGAPKKAAVQKRSEPTAEEKTAHQEKINAVRDEMNAIINTARDVLREQFQIDIDPVKADASGEEVFEEYFRLQILKQILYEARPSREFIAEHLSGTRWRGHVQAPAKQRARDTLGRFK
jgi:hypothetical protein